MNACVTRPSADVVQMMCIVKSLFFPASSLRGWVTHAPLCGDVGDPCTNGLCAVKKWFAAAGCHCGSGAPAPITPTPSPAPPHIWAPRGGGPGGGGGPGRAPSPSPKPSGCCCCCCWAEGPHGETMFPARGEPKPRHPGGAPTPTPALPPTTRRSDTISSSSAASADEPSTPLGLGERRTGDAVLSDPVDVEVAEGGVVVPLVLGRPIGARGRPMRPTSGAGVEPMLFELERRPAPGANPELGGPMGAGGT